MPGSELRSRGAARRLHTDCPRHDAGRTDAGAGTTSVISARTLKIVAHAFCCCLGWRKRAVHTQVSQRAGIVLRCSSNAVVGKQRGGRRRRRCWEGARSVIRRAYTLKIVAHAFCCCLGWRKRAVHTQVSQRAGIVLRCSSNAVCREGDLSSDICHPSFRAELRALSLHLLTYLLTYLLTCTRAKIRGACVTHVQVRIPVRIRIRIQEYA